MSYLEKIFSLDNKVAIVTGAAKGNGKAISEALLNSGASVILVDIKKKELKQTVKSFLVSRFYFFIDFLNSLYAILLSIFNL